MIKIVFAAFRGNYTIMVETIQLWQKHPKASYPLNCLYNRIVLITLIRRNNVQIFFLLDTQYYW